MLTPSRACIRDRWLVSATVAVALLVGATACGSSDDSSEGGEGVTQDTTLDSATVTIAPQGDPKQGGTLTYGLEAETDGLNPANNRFAGSGTTVGLAIYDPLVAFDADGATQPYLAESLTPNDDFTQWNIKVRPGITFHNGQPLDGAAVKGQFDAAKNSLLVSFTIKNIETVEVDPADPLAVNITTATPWSSLPVFLTGQLGMIAAPEQLALDAAAAGDRPIGTGPFVFKNRTLDREVVTERNENYWQTDADGRALPYLDGVTFRIIPDQPARGASMSGSNPLSMAMFNDAENIKKFLDEGKAGQIQIVVDEGEREEDVIMLNTASAPFDNILARQALAHATDTAQYNEIMNANLFELANGPFRESSKWYAETPYPEYDPAKAQELVAQYTAETGEPLAFTMYNSGDNRMGLETLQAQFQAVGIQVTIDVVPQDDFVTMAALGNFQALEWRQFGGLDPDYEYLWWSGTNAADVGGLGLNFARNVDPILDAALEDGRSSTDFDARYAAYETVQTQLNAGLPYIWLDHVQAVVVAQNSVRGITNGPLPNGEAAWPIGGPGGFGAVTFLTQTWFE